MVSGWSKDLEVVGVGVLDGFSYRAVLKKYKFTFKLS